MRAISSFIKVTHCLLTDCYENEGSSFIPSAHLPSIEYYTAKSVKPVNIFTSLWIRKYLLYSQLVYCDILASEARNPGTVIHLLSFGAIFFFTGVYSCLFFFSLSHYLPLSYLHFSNFLSYPLNLFHSCGPETCFHSTLVLIPFLTWPAKFVDVWVFMHIIILLTDWTVSFFQMKRDWCVNIAVRCILIKFHIPWSQLCYKK